MRVRYAIAFYRDVLGLPLEFETPGRCRPGLAVPDLDAFHRRMEE